MSPYQLTDEEQQMIKELDDFRNSIAQWSNTSSLENRQQYRSQINRQLDHIREIVILAGCLRTLNIIHHPLQLADM